MHVPPKTPENRPYVHTPSWGDVIASYALLAVIPLGLWALSHPLTAVLGLGGGLGVLFVYRQGRDWLLEASRTGLSIQIGRTLQINVTRPVDTKNTPSEVCCP